MNLGKVQVALFCIPNNVGYTLINTLLTFQPVLVCIKDDLVLKKIDVKLPNKICTSRSDEIHTKTKNCLNKYPLVHTYWLSISALYR